MVVLRAIGRFFAKIGRWIRDTAWIQPLLIVGGIFGLIFSISPIVNAIKSATKDNTDASTVYYKKNQLTWTNAKTNKSSVDEFFSYIQDQETHKANQDSLYKKFGDKFFVNFVKENCEYCANNYEGYKYLQNNWGKGEFAFLDDEGNVIKKGEEGYENFKIFNIFVDKTYTDDDGEKVFYFTKYVLGNDKECRYNEVFENFANIKTNYTVNESIDVASKLIDTNEDSFTPPVVMLFDFNFSQPAGEYYDLSTTLDYGLTEIFFNNGGDSSSSLDRAKFAWECWNHNGAFSKTGERTK